jgi:hypothetical protein
MRKDSLKRHRPDSTDGPRPFALTDVAALAAPLLARTDLA